MALQGGDRKFGHGDELTVENTSGGPVEPGMVVSVTGDGGNEPEVGLADTNGAGAVHGVAATQGALGGKLKATLRGAVVARVESGVVAGEELGAPDTSGTGTAGVLDTGSGGVHALTDAEERDGVHYAVVHL